MIATSRLIAESALLRRESRGGHYRRDFPRTKRKWTGKHITW
jgi:L-aspartate oxidase